MSVHWKKKGEWTVTIIHSGSASPSTIAPGGLSGPIDISSPTLWMPALWMSTFRARRWRITIQAMR